MDKTVETVDWLLSLVALLDMSDGNDNKKALNYWVGPIKITASSSSATRVR